ncbi:MAG: hypothetical protein JXP73_07060 [Deltaproteobacteria bacterium]|nr:hypothetical protein [Deltaproteobacteria bacterium]
MTPSLTSVLTKTGHLFADKRESHPCFGVTVSLLFCLALSIVHHHHEFWRDEIHCWSLARNSDGLWELLTGHRRYDGHPFLWYYVLHLASRISRSEVVLHLVTIVVATSSAYLWVRHSGLPRILRLLLLGSYCFFFEYGVISRSYALGILLGFLFCWLYDPRDRRIGRLFPVLFLLSFTSFYGAVLAFSLGVFLLWQSIAKLASGQLPRWQRRALHRQWSLGLGLAGFALYLHLVTSLLPADSWFGPISGASILSADGFPHQFWAGLLPWQIPARRDGSWIVSGFLGYGDPFVKEYLPVFAGAFLSLWLWSLRRVPAAVVTLFVGLVCMAFSQAYQYGGYLRHWAHAFVLLVLLVWLHAKHSKRPAVLLPVLLGATLLVQGVTCVRAVEAEVEFPFSSGKEAADFLRDHGLADETILATADHPASTVAGYLDRHFLFVESRTEAQTVVYHSRRCEDPSVPQILTLAKEIIRIRGKPVLLVVNRDMDGQNVPGVRYELLFETKPALRGDEGFQIHRVRSTD